MKALLFRFFYKPKYVHRYSSVTVYYCMRLFEPKVVGHSVFFPVRWFNADFCFCLKDPRQLPYIRQGLSYR